MRLATVRTADGRTHAAREDGSGLTLLPWTDLSALLGEPGWAELACCDGRAVSREEVTYHTLVPQPNKIICLGLNYATHIAEMGRPTPEHPTLFAKFSGALIGASDPITLPYVSDQVDWEAELGVVIGSPARHLPAATALDAVAGYTVINDVTVRDWQHRTREFLSGKTFEATTPVGPVLVTLEELPTGAAGLDISCAVDSVEMQLHNGRPAVRRGSHRGLREHDHHAAARRPHRDRHTRRCRGGAHSKAVPQTWARTRHPHRGHWAAKQHLPAGTAAPLISPPRHSRTHGS